MLAARFQLRQFQVLSSRLSSGQTQPPKKETTPPKVPKGQTQTPKKETAPPKVPETVIDDTPVGPGACKAGEYKNPEYFKYDSMSYFDIEVAMKKDRLPQPSSRK